MLDDYLKKLAANLLSPEPPSPEEVSYEPPNKDGSSKKCGNCWKWSRDEKCLEVEGKVTELQNCNYHVYGTPQQRWINLGASLMSHSVAGLITSKEGTCCGNCSAYNNGSCVRVFKDEKPAQVEFKGCCTAWKPK